MANNSPLPGYNVNPSPVSGQGPYGMVPGNIGIPPSTWQQVGAVAPGLGNTSQLTNNILSELHGDINPQALKNMQDAAASYGVSSGMPGSNAMPGTLAFNKNLRNIGLDTLQVQRQGQQDYLSALQGIGAAQTPQGLAAEIAAHNSQLNAAPDPQSAALQQQANYWAALNAMRRQNLGGRGGGFDPAGGTGQYAAPTSPNLGFGFGTLGQQNQNIPAGGNGGYGVSTATTPGGSSLTYTGQDFGDLFGNPYGGTQSPSPYAPQINWGNGVGYDQNAYVPNLGYDQGTDLGYGGGYTGGYGVGYDQSALPDFSGYGNAIDNPYDYYGSF